MDGEGDGRPGDGFAGHPGDTLLRREVNGFVGAREGKSGELPLRGWSRCHR